MEERKNLEQQDNLIIDIVLPSLFTVLILFCLVQVGLSVWSPADGIAEEPEKVTAISAFAS